MIADMFRNKKPNPVVIELFIREKRFNVSPVFYTQSYFSVPRNTRLN